MWIFYGYLFAGSSISLQFRNQFDAIKVKLKSKILYRKFYPGTFDLKKTKSIKSNKIF